MKTRKNSTIKLPVSAALLFIFVLFSHFILNISAGSLHAFQWKQAIGERIWSFPRDHGCHPDYRTEWWYFTGNLSDERGQKFGYQLTFFRQGMERSESVKNNTWSIDDVYLAHFAVVDISQQQFSHGERISRKGPGLASSSLKGMEVHVLNWSAKMMGDVISLNARHQGMEIRLELSPTKPAVLHGWKGLSKKGPKEGQSSFYYSFTALKTKGSLKTTAMKTPVNVEGISWFDHEFGSNQLTEQQTGWDWFSIHLSDGRDIMVYFLRKKDGTVEGASSGTIVEKNGTTRHLALADVNISVLGTWKSPETGGSYPSAWRIGIPSADIDISLSAAVPHQEMTTEASTGVTYWEGVVSGNGLSSGKTVSLEGYAELTGYAGSLGGIF